MPSVLALHARGDRTGPSLPKFPSAALTVLPHGVEGDVNRYRQRRRGGDLRMGLLVLPWAVLEDLQRDGWPVRPGDLGENVTLEGVANESLVAGVHMRLGPYVEVELTEPSIPCRTLAQLPYVGAERLRAFQRTLQGRRGFYAQVVQPGSVEVGAPVRLLAFSSPPHNLP